MSRISLGRFPDPRAGTEQKGAATFRSPESLLVQVGFLILLDSRHFAIGVEGNSKTLSRIHEPITGLVQAGNELVAALSVRLRCPPDS
jgi:hypothetical protein